MQKVTNVLHLGLRWLYKSIAILLVLIAVLLSCVRLMLPYAENYRDNLQNYINDQYQTNIIIGAINMGWSSSGPTLLAENISLLDAQGVAISVGSFEVEMDFWKSLRYQEFITTNFTLNQANIYVDPELLEQSEAETEQHVVLDKLSHLFLTQIPRFVVKNSQVEVKVADTHSSFAISELAWLNKNNRHQAQGNIVVDYLSSNKLQLILDLQGGHRDSLTGQAYFQAKDINITPWINDFLAKENNQTDSAINAESWVEN